MHTECCQGRASTNLTALAHVVAVQCLQNTRQHTECHTCTCSPVATVHNYCKQGPVAGLPPSPAYQCVMLAGEPLCIL